MTVFPVATIIELAEMSIGSVFVCWILFSHATLDNDDGRDDDHEDTGNNTDGYHHVSPGADVVVRHLAVPHLGSSHWSHIRQGLPGWNIRTRHHEEELTQRWLHAGRLQSILEHVSSVALQRSP